MNEETDVNIDVLLKSHELINSEIMSYELKRT